MPRSGSRICGGGSPRSRPVPRPSRDGIRRFHVVSPLPAGGFPRRANRFTRVAGGFPPGWNRFTLAADPFTRGKADSPQGQTDSPWRRTDQPQGRRIFPRGRRILSRGKRILSRGKRIVLRGKSTFKKGGPPRFSGCRIPGGPGTSAIRVVAPNKGPGVQPPPRDEDPPARCQAPFGRPPLGARPSHFRRSQDGRGQPLPSHPRLSTHKSCDRYTQKGRSANNSCR
jgi:hypothetical protein